MVGSGVRRSTRAVIARSATVRRVGWAALFAALLNSGCGIGWSDQQISMVEVRDDDRTLVVGYHCEPDAAVEAEESAEEVRLTFRIYGSTGNDCADFEEVEFDAPLGGRRVIDNSNGAEITPCRGSEVPSGSPCI